MSGAPGAGESILVIKPSSLGDIVHTLPAVGLLKKARPGSRIAWLINTEWAPLLQDNPHIDEVIIFPRRRFQGLKGVPNIVIWANTMRKRRFDLVLDFQGLLRSALVARLVRGGKVLGFADAREGARLFYNRAVPVGANQHAVGRYLNMIEDLGISTQTLLEFPLPAGEKPHPFHVSGPFLLLHPFSRGLGKSMPQTAVRALCKEMMPTPIVVAGKTENSVELPRNCINMLNKTTLPELIWLIRNAHYVVSVDSGPMHIAAAITERVLGIHTSTSPFLVGPCNPDAWVWSNNALLPMHDVTQSHAEGSLSFGLEHIAQVTDFLRSKF